MKVILFKVVLDFYSSFLFSFQRVCLVWFLGWVCGGFFLRFFFFKKKKGRKIRVFLEK